MIIASKNSVTAITGRNPAIEPPLENFTSHCKSISSFQKGLGVVSYIPTSNYEFLFNFQYTNYNQMLVSRPFRSHRFSRWLSSKLEISKPIIYETFSILDLNVKSIPKQSVYTQKWNLHISSKLVGKS